MLSQKLNALTDEITIDIGEFKAGLYEIKCGSNSALLYVQ